MMNGTIDQLKQELKNADGGNLHPASEEDLEEARQFGFPDVLLTFYRDSAPDATDGRVELNQRIWSVQNAITENRDYVPGADLFPLGYVVFASNKFGDAYCLDTNHVNASGDYSIVLFPHDTIADGASLEDVKPYRLVVAGNFEDFLQKFSAQTLIEKPLYD